MAKDTLQQRRLGGARPTLTRIAVGGLVAGPLGAVIGGTAQKHKKVSSKTIMHDTRSFRLIINSTDGYIQEDNNIFDPQNFIGSILNAIADYSKNKNSYRQKKEKLEKSLGQKRKNLLVKKKQAELDALIKNASDEDKKALAKQEKIDTVLRFILILVIIGAIIMLNMLNNNNK